MAHPHRVLTSINGYDASTCVDIFERDDGTFGFAEFRRDPEDARGWFARGDFASLRFPQEAEALAAARASVPWLADVLARGKGD